VPVAEWSWDSEEPRLLIVKMISPVNWADIEQLQRDQMGAPYPERWAVLVDFREAGRLPQISVSHVARLIKGTPHPGVCAFAVVGVSGFLYALIPLLARLYPSLEAKFLMVNTVPEARAWLLERLGPDGE
jgi:hypothetical protein